MAAQGSRRPLAGRDGQDRACRLVAHRHAVEKICRLSTALFREQTQVTTLEQGVVRIIFYPSTGAAQTAKSRRAGNNRSRWEYRFAVSPALIVFRASCFRSRALLV